VRPARTSMLSIDCDLVLITRDRDFDACAEIARLKILGT
jgi:hypothetical protein